VILVKTVQPT